MSRSTSTRENNVFDIRLSALQAEGSRSKALQLVSSLRMGAVALREERQSLTIDAPLAIADLCSEMRFLDRESLRVVLLDAKQHLIKVAIVSQVQSTKLPPILARFLSLSSCIGHTALSWYKFMGSTHNVLCGQNDYVIRRAPRQAKQTDPA
jgi:hypothetical protein